MLGLSSSDCGMELQVWRVDPVDFHARGHTHVTGSCPLMGEGDVQGRIRGRKKKETENA